MQANQPEKHAPYAERADVFGGDVPVSMHIVLFIWCTYFCGVSAFADVSSTGILG